MTTPTFTIRQANINDLNEIIDIDNQANLPFSEDEWAVTYDDIHSHIIIADDNDGCLIGFIVYGEYTEDFETITILNIGVHHRWTENGVGTALVGQILSKLHIKTCSIADVYIHIEDYPLLNFFKSHEFKAEGQRTVCRNDQEIQAYKMVHQLRLTIPHIELRNRIADHNLGPLT